MDLSNLSWDCNSFSQSNEAEIQPDIQQAEIQGEYACRGVNLVPGRSSTAGFTWILRI